ncbi:hypothetical protein LguiA_006279 [Lonicera macranthoides]
MHTVERIGKKVDRIGKKVNLSPHASEEDEEAQVEQPATLTSNDEEADNEDIVSDSDSAEF